MTTLENGYITDRFSFDHQFGTYSDAIVMLEAEYKALSANQIAAIKQQRFDNWVNIIQNPTVSE